MSDMKPLLKKHKLLTGIVVVAALTGSVLSACSSQAKQAEQIGFLCDFTYRQEVPAMAGQSAYAVEKTAKARINIDTKSKTWWSTDFESDEPEFRGVFWFFLTEKQSRLASADQVRFVLSRPRTLDSESMGGGPKGAILSFGEMSISRVGGAFVFDETTVGGEGADTAEPMFVTWRGHCTPGQFVPPPVPAS